MSKRTKRRWQRTFRKYVNGTKGVISLFLAILMVPFVTLAGALINAGRINSAVAIFDEALCNASNSTLGTYDHFLRSRFALMAMEQDTSSGGTKFGNTSPNYTAEDLISDTFEYYMEQNVGTLSNTYKTTELNAAGLYPLSDTSVLLSSVLQCSKITVPAKLAADWGNFDDIVKKITGPLSTIGSIEEMIGSGADVVTGIGALEDARNEFELAYKEYDAAKTAYETAHTQFVAAAETFNTLVDNILTTQQLVEEKQEEFDRLKRELEPLEREVKELRDLIAEYRADSDEDDSDIIEELQEEISELNQEISEIRPEYNRVKRELDKAKKDLKSYISRFDSVRKNLIQKKEHYYTTIVTLRDAVDRTCSAVKKFQNAANTLISNAKTFAENTVSTGVTVALEHNEKCQKELQEEADRCVVQADLAGKDGYTEYQNYYYQIQQENETAILELKEEALSLRNGNAVAQEVSNIHDTVNQELAAFSQRSLTAEYQTIYRELNDLRLYISGLSVPNSYTEFSYSDRYYEVTAPVQEHQLSGYIKGIEDNIVQSVGWSVLKAIVGFVQALFSLDVFFNPNLQATINEGIYAPNGGLPSKIDRSIYSLASPYQTEDAELSEYYKSVLNTYSGETIYITADNATSLFDQIQRDINDLMKLLNDFKLINLVDIFKIAKNIISGIISFFGNIAANIMYSIRNKMLLVGYVSYNTANRTTFGRKALTGAPFGLPSSAAAGGYVFAGAETEYIIIGSMSELLNQSMTFLELWLLRMPFDLPAILKDNTIRTLASGLAAITYGIAYFIVYAVFLAAEGYVDCIILCNGGTIPIAKDFVYLTPGGLPKLVRALTSLTLSEEMQQEIYEGAVECTLDAEDDIEDIARAKNVEGYARYDNYYPPYKDYARGKTDNLYDPKFDGEREKAYTDGKSDKILFEFDYTKSLQILMLLTVGTEKMLRRLADIIEMESAYQATKGAGTYLFNLDKSFTYLRASGSFTSGVFIKIGEDSELTSNKRVIYNGY